MKPKGNDIIKKEAIAKYGSIRKFALELEIPPGTVSAILNTSLDNVSYSTVLKMCHKLKLDPINLTPLTHDRIHKLTENKILKYYTRLNNTGKRRFIELLEGMVQLPRYLNEKEGEEYESDI